MKFLRTLIESRPFLTRIPDQSLLTTDAGRGPDHTQATRDRDGSYALIYSASGRPFAVDLSKLSGERVQASWYDPREGTAQAIGTIPRRGTREFRPPSQGKRCDWILVLDDASRGFPPPGTHPG
jgi:hypothetical protein